MNEKDVERKRILLIGEKPDPWFFAMLQAEGYDVAAIESPYRAWGVHRVYKPHFIVVQLRYPKDIAILEETVALAGRAPVVAAMSFFAKEALVKAVREKAASVIVLPAKPRTIRETLGNLDPSKKR